MRSFTRSETSQWISQKVIPNFCSKNNLIIILDEMIACKNVFVISLATEEGNNRFILYLFLWAIFFIVGENPRCRIWDPFTFFWRHNIGIIKHSCISGTWGGGLLWWMIVMGSIHLHLSLHRSDQAPPPPPANQSCTVVSNLCWVAYSL